jgi:GDPmannose 4,6-dehydratase
MLKKVIITGISGQDGYFLANFLHNKGYQVYGIVHGQNSVKMNEAKENFPFAKIIAGDIVDAGFVFQLIKKIEPDEIYNLAAVSHVGYSFTTPAATLDTDAKGVLNFLEAIRLHTTPKKIKFYQASTSEMFGGTPYAKGKIGHDENSVFYPKSPYGCAKLYAH